MGENVPYTSYLSQKEHSFTFIKKCNFSEDLKLLWHARARGLNKILARTLLKAPDSYKDLIYSGFVTLS
jgi:hypothetical protein